jgi:hypothetical protein
MTQTDPFYCEMAALESVQIRSPLFWDTTLHYFVIDNRHFERTMLFRNMGHKSSGDGAQYNRTTVTKFSKQNRLLEEFQDIVQCRK